MALDPTKTLDINAIEPALGELLEHYRQALRAAELLPRWGSVPISGHLATDEIRSHFAVRWLVRMFLRSHIRSKLRTIADRLEVERFASGHMDANTLKRLGDIIRKLRNYDKSLTQRRTFWVRLLEGIWVVVASVLTTHLVGGIPYITMPATEVLAYIVLYLLYFTLLFWIPLFIFGALGGFNWKRLILLGQTGDMNIYIATTAVLHWVPMPQANTYESENRFFGILGLPKPSEFPWDLALQPGALALTAFTVAFFLLSVIFFIAAKTPGWAMLIAVAFLIASCFCLYAMLCPISRAMRERRQRSAC